MMVTIQESNDQEREVVDQGDRDQATEHEKRCGLTSASDAIDVGAKVIEIQ